MDPKYYSFLIFSGAHGKLRKIQLPFYIIHLILAFAAVGALTVVALANSYTRMLLKVSNYNDLRTDRESLKTQYRTLENAASRTNAELDSLQLLAAEVVLTYGFGGTRRERFPEELLALATEGHASESNFGTTRYAFSLMKEAALNSSGTSAGMTLLANLRIDRPTVPSIWPVRGYISGAFGQRMDPFSGEGAFHSGLDICAPVGTGVEAAGEGLVFYAGSDLGYGNEVLIDHGYGIKTKYGHLSKIFVVAGQEVKRGEMIGAVGTTGRTTGPHLHYEVLVHETPVNPAKYLRG